MNNSLVVALAITVAGMGLLFLALGFFYGLLTLISSLLQDKAPPVAEVEAVEQAAAERPAEEEAMLQAAAIAVALARAETEGKPALAPAGAGVDSLSPWWSLHQGSRMAAGSSPWRRP